LLETHKIEISAASLGARVKRKREPFQAAAKEIVRETIKRTIPPALDSLDRQRRRLSRLATLTFNAALSSDRLSLRADEPKALAQYLDITEQLRKVVDTTLKYSGAGEPDGAAEQAEAAARISSRLDRLLAASGASGSSPGSGADPG
jgi:hypothetical protein